MRVFKSVKQAYAPSADTDLLIESFRLMVNDCIRIGVRENVTSLKSLSTKAYKSLSKYDVATCHRVCAVAKAASILRMYRRGLKRNPAQPVPYARRSTLHTCYGFKLEGGKLCITVRARHYATILLTQHTCQTLAAQQVTVRSITLTNCELAIDYCREVEPIEPTGFVGIDTNVGNLTVATSHGDLRRYDLSSVDGLKQKYRNIRQHIRRNDRRIVTKLLHKYGTIERNKVGWILHNISSRIVNDAKVDGFAIVMEDIRKIRTLYQCGDRKGRDFRAKMNSWSYREIQRQIEYKAKWVGVAVTYVDPAGTSAMCSICGSRVYPNEHRAVFCRKCRTNWDRDENAARNILNKGAPRFGAIGPAIEAMKAATTNEVNPRVDAGKSGFDVEAFNSRA